MSMHRSGNRERDDGRDSDMSGSASRDNDHRSHRSRSRDRNRDDNRGRDGSREETQRSRSRDRNRDDRRSRDESKKETRGNVRRDSDMSGSASRDNDHRSHRSRSRDRNGDDNRGRDGSREETQRNRSRDRNRNDSRSRDGSRKDTRGNVRRDSDMSGSASRDNDHRSHRSGSRDRNRNDKHSRDGSKKATRGNVRRDRDRSGSAWRDNNHRSRRSRSRDWCRDDSRSRDGSGEKSSRVRDQKRERAREKERDKERERERERKREGKRERGHERERDKGRDQEYKGGREYRMDKEREKERKDRKRRSRSQHGIEREGQRENGPGRAIAGTGLVENSSLLALFDGAVHKDRSMFWRFQNPDLKWASNTTAIFEQTWYREFFSELEDAWNRKKVSAAANTFELHGSAGTGKSTCSLLLISRTVHWVSRPDILLIRRLETNAQKELQPDEGFDADLLWRVEEDARAQHAVITCDKYGTNEITSVVDMLKVRNSSRRLLLIIDSLQPTSFLRDLRRGGINVNLCLYVTSFGSRGRALSYRISDDAEWPFELEYHVPDVMKSDYLQFGYECAAPDTQRWLEEVADGFVRRTHSTANNSSNVGASAVGLIEGVFARETDAVIATSRAAVSAVDDDVAVHLAVNRLSRINISADPSQVVVGGTNSSSSSSASGAYGSSISQASLRDRDAILKAKTIVYVMRFAYQILGGSARFLTNLCLNKEMREHELAKKGHVLQMEAWLMQALSKPSCPLKQLILHECACLLCRHLTEKQSKISTGFLLKKSIDLSSLFLRQTVTRDDRGKKQYISVASTASLLFVLAEVCKNTEGAMLEYLYKALESSGAGFLFEKITMHNLFKELKSKGKIVLTGIGKNTKEFDMILFVDNDNLNWVGLDDEDSIGSLRVNDFAVSRKSNLSMIDGAIIQAEAILVPKSEQRVNMPMKRNSSVNVSQFGKSESDTFFDKTGCLFADASSSASPSASPSVSQMPAPPNYDEAQHRIERGVTVLLNACVSTEHALKRSNEVLSACRLGKLANGWSGFVVMLYLVTAKNFADFKVTAEGDSNLLTFKVQCEDSTLQRVNKLRILQNEEDGEEESLGIVASDVGQDKHIASQKSRIKRGQRDSSEDDLSGFIRI